MYAIRSYYGSAGAVAAAVGQYEALAQRGRKDRLAFVDGELVTARLKSDAVHDRRIVAMKRLLIAGFGDVARRLVSLLPAGVDLRTLSRRLGADLDRPETLAAAQDWADCSYNFV